MEDLSRPSGISIPLFLKRKWEKEHQEQRPEDPAVVCDSSNYEELDKKDDDSSTNKNTSGDKTYTTPTIWEPELRLRPDKEITRDEMSELSNRVFTSAELEERIWKTEIAMFDIQRQLHRGEEIYYEDTYNHGNIYKRWDAFVDMKDIGMASASGNGGTQASSIRRVPADSRWFSTSCGSVSRTKLPASFPPPLVARSVSLTEKSLPIADQRHAKISNKVTHQTLSKSSNSASATTATDSRAETNPLLSAKEGQPITDPKAIASTSAMTGAENLTAGGDSNADNRPTTPIGSEFNVDAKSTKKKMKSTTTASESDETSAKKKNKKSSEDGTKRPKITGATKIEGTTKSDTGKQRKEPTVSYGDNSNKDETSTHVKREREVEPPVPRKRGRPRRKM